MSLKIVFDGQEYDSVDAMPPDVRKEYEVALESLRKTGGDEILSVLQRGTPRPTLRDPPIVTDDQPRRGGLLRILVWMALGALIALWLVRHR
jgi:hypothetical protein